MDLTFAHDIASRLPNFMVAWGHPDQARQSLARAADLLKQHNATADSGHQWPIPPGVDTSVGIPGLTVFRMSTPRQESGLLNTQQLSLGFQNGSMGTDTNDTATLNKINLVSAMPVKCIYEVVGVCRNEIDRATMERALWFSWANQPLDVHFQDVNGNSHVHTCPKYPEGDPAYSFELMDEIAGNLIYQVNWQWRLDGHWFNSQLIPAIKSINVTYKEMIEGCPVLDTQVITPNSYCPPPIP